MSGSAWKSRVWILAFLGSKCPLCGSFLQLLKFPFILSFSWCWTYMDIKSLVISEILQAFFRHLRATLGVRFSDLHSFRQFNVFWDEGYMRPPNNSCCRNFDKKILELRGSNGPLGMFIFSIFKSLAPFMFFSGWELRDNVESFIDVSYSDKKLWSSGPVYNLRIELISMPM